MRRAWVVVFTALTVSVVAVACAHAAFPGAHGKIAFGAFPGGTDMDVFVINPDGTGEQQLTSSPAFDGEPAWSPDGARIAFMSRRDGNDEIYVMKADGSQQTRLTTDPAADRSPAWSPDGTRIVFHSNRDGDNEIHVMNADGTGVQQLTQNTVSDLNPAWSPDGMRIAFSRRIGSPGDFHDRLFVMSADGNGATQITFQLGCGFFHLGDKDANWSPSGARLAYYLQGDLDGEWCSEIRTVGPDGSNDVQVIEGREFEFDGPAWAPSGTKIAYASNGVLVIINPDGTGGTFPRDPLGGGAHGVDWQPLVRKEFPRPKGATPLRASLVTAFHECTVPNRTHGPPLDFVSCTPPPQRSDHLTVGTVDNNNAASNFSGAVRFDTIVGNPATPADEADVRINVAMGDIRCRPLANACGSANAASGADYTGALTGSVALRLTDEHNAPFPDPATGAGPGTVQDTSFTFPIGCAQTASTAIGSGCGVSTTADAVVPGLVRERDRAIWQLGQVQVLDGGPDGDPNTPANTHVFLVQGVFVP